MNDFTSAMGATGEVRPLHYVDLDDHEVVTLHVDAGGGESACGAALDACNHIAIGYTRPTCAKCIALVTGDVRITQRRVVRGDRAILRVDVEGVGPPSIGQLQLAPGFLLSGATSPMVVYRIRSQWVDVVIQETDDGVRVELHPNVGAGLGDAGIVWHGVFDGYVQADVSWWSALALCEWGDEAPEAAAS